MRSPIVREFASPQIGLALGLTNVIHAAVLAGRAGDGFVERVGRFGASAEQDVTTSLVSTAADR